MSIRWIGLGVGAVVLFVGAIWLVRPEEQPPTGPQNGQAVNTPSRAVRPASEHDLHPEVWTKNGYDGPSYEYKVNCGPNYATLNECFLFDLTRVAVNAPDGTVYELEKDFNIQGYSGEVTRRWVLYGPADGGLPAAGSYTFRYYRGDELAYAQSVNYQPEVIGYPTNITWRRQGSDLLVEWTPPTGMRQGMFHKVILFPEGQSIISQRLDWDATSARLTNIPLPAGTRAEMNVASYFDGGYAYPENIVIIW
jgi:hypothetical protein